MRIHRFAKEDCKCTRRATYYKCVFCGTREYASEREIRRLHKAAAECPHPDAPAPASQERFRGFLGGTFDCLGTEADRPENDK